MIIKNANNYKPKIKINLISQIAPFCFISEGLNNDFNKILFGFYMNKLDNACAARGVKGWSSENARSKRYIEGRTSGYILSRLPAVYIVAWVIGTWADHCAFLAR